MAIWNQPGTAGQPITAALLNELRTNYKTPESAVTFSPTYSATLNVSAVGESIPDVFGTRITQLRSAINTLESKMSVNCNCNNCCQTCQTCQTCQSCQGCQTAAQCSATCQSHAQCTVINCVCSSWNCDCGSSCFPAGTMIRTVNNREVPIEEIKVGDKVLGLDGVNTVVDLMHPKLGDRNLMYLPGLYFSGDHLFWVRVGDKEWFGTNDYNEYIRKQRESEYIGLAKSAPYVITCPIDYATIDGWKKLHRMVLRENHNPDLQLYHLVTDNSHTYIANGYVVGGEVRDDDYDYVKSRWLGNADSNVSCKVASCNCDRCQSKL